MGKQCGNAGCRLENKSQEVGSERESEKKEVQSETLAHQEEQSLPEEPHEGGRRARSEYERALCQQRLGEFMQWD